MLLASMADPDLLDLKANLALLVSLAGLDLQAHKDPSVVSDLKVNQVHQASLVAQDHKAHKEDPDPKVALDPLDKMELLVGQDLLVPLDLLALLAV